jgi:hypothetical protein
MNEQELLARMGAASGLVVRPGDVLVLTYADADLDELDEWAAYLHNKLPGVRVALLGGDIRMAVMRPAELDSPARPLVELRESPGTKIETTGLACTPDGTEHAATLDAAPHTWELPDAG